MFCRVAVRKLGYTGASVARFLGMTTSSVNRMARLEELTELDAWDKEFAFTPTSPPSGGDKLGGDKPRRYMGYGRGGEKMCGKRFVGAGFIPAQNSYV